jgi:hypothetical protein
MTCGKYAGRWPSGRRKRGLPEQRAANFLIAVSQIATNAARHRPPVRGCTRRSWETLAPAEVRDTGPWPPGPAGDAAFDGLGMSLRLARLACDDLAIRRSTDGSTVILRMNLPG